MFFLGYLFIIVKDLYSSAIILSLSLFFFFFVGDHLGKWFLYIIHHFGSP